MSRATSQTAKVRRLMLTVKVLGGVCAFAAVIACVMLSVYLVRENHDRLAFANEAKQSIALIFETDGVLNRQWVEERLADQFKDLENVELRVVRERIESHGQVREAQVSVRLPDKLRVTIRERQPVVRARMIDRDGSRRDLVVAADGVVYHGYGYPKSMMQHLPYLAGVRFVRQGDGFRPVPGMDVVAELLDLARIETPEIYRSWRVVSCEQFGGDRYALNALIRIEGGLVGETVFLPYEFESQLESLRQVITHAQRQGVKQLHRVDLSLDSRAIVQVAPTEGPMTRRGHR